MSIGANFERMNRWARSLQLHAPVSAHHELAVSELWPLLADKGIETALEVGAGEPPYLVARMLEEQGIAVHTLDGLSPCSLPGDAHNIPANDASFDLVVARHCLEHVLCPYLALAEMARVSKRWLLVIVPAEGDKGLNWPDHLWYLGQAGWELMFRKLCLEVRAFGVGDHTEEYARQNQLWQDLEWRYLLTKRE